MFQLCMNKFEWTLSARVNSKDTDTHSNSIDSSPPPAVHVEETTACDCEGAGSDFPVVTDYFCVTAPVCKPTVYLGDDNGCPHYVVKYTETVVVDLRFKPEATICVSDDKNQQKCLTNCTEVLQLFDKIADVVRGIVIDTLHIKDPTKYRYVGHMHTWLQFSHTYCIAA